MTASSGKQRQNASKSRRYAGSAHSFTIRMPVNRVEGRDRRRAGEMPSGTWTGSSALVPIHAGRPATPSRRMFHGCSVPPVRSVISTSWLPPLAWAHQREQAALRSQPEAFGVGAHVTAGFDASAARLGSPVVPDGINERRIGRNGHARVCMPGRR
jgi:hypothetical protein